jgi:SAM-dependent methyltransferase
MYHSQPSTGGEEDGAVVAYVVAGVGIAQLYQRVLTGAFGSAGPRTVLDFASGYGRGTRYLPHLFPDATIWVSDILRPAVGFQVEHFGVNGMVSRRVPEEFSPPLQFDAIFVTSLFTHLPAETFARWLRRLISLLDPNGLLLFTTHDLGIARDQRGAADGFLFERRSEIPSLDLDDYGLTFVSEAYVRSCLESMEVQPSCYRRARRGLQGYQDIYVVSKAPDRDLSVIDLEPKLRWGIDRIILWRSGAPGTGLSAIGWAATAAPDDSLAEIALTQGRSVIAQAELSGSRPDVADFHADERYLASGWSLQTPLAEAAPGDLLSIVASTASGHRQCLWAGYLPLTPHP